MKRISTMLHFALLLLVGTVVAQSSANCQDIGVSTHSLSFPATPVGTSSVQSYTLGVSVPSGGTARITVTAPIYFQVNININGFNYGYTNSQTLSIGGGNNSFGMTIDVKFTPTIDTPPDGSRGNVTNVESNYNLSANVLLSSAPLPVELSTFTIKDPKKNTVELEWTTISEKNNYGFYVQKSADGKTDFATLGFVPGNGTSLSTHTYSYTDNASPFTFYRLKQVDVDGSIQYSNTISPAMAGLASMSTPRLDQNFPNPFNPSTCISFSITKEGPVTLRVFDILGREVATLVNENRKAGQYTERFDGSRFASGVYMYVLQSAEGRLTSRMILSK